MPTSRTPSSSSVHGRCSAAERGLPVGDTCVTPCGTTSPRTGATSWPGFAPARRTRWAGQVILLVGPAPPSSTYGNAVTATRWAEILRQLGHPVRVAQSYDGGEYQVLVALHAR